MKYTITINQAAAVSAGLKLNLCDLIIFDFIKDFFSSTYAQWVAAPDGLSYCYIAHTLICKQLPLLNMTERSIRRHCANLCACGVLKKFDDFKKPVYRQGDNFDLLINSIDNCCQFNANKPDNRDQLTGQTKPLNRTNETIKPDKCDLSNLYNRTNATIKPDRPDRLTGQTALNNRTNATTYNNSIINKEYNNSIIKEKKRDLIFDFIQREKLSIDADEFFNYYESRSWINGNGSKITNWEALARAWDIRKKKYDLARQPGQIGRTHKFKFYSYNEVCNAVTSKIHTNKDFSRTDKKSNNGWLWVLNSDYAQLTPEQLVEFNFNIINRNNNN